MAGRVLRLANFEPLAHVWKADEEEVELSLLADGDFTPVRVRLRFEGGALEGTVSDRALARIAEKQVARIFSLDHDGTGWDALAITRLYPGLRPVWFSSPYEAACWAIVSQRISKVQAARVVASLVAEHGAFPTPKELRASRACAASRR